MSSPAPVCSSHRFISFDEMPIFYRKLKTSSELKGMIVIVHGMAEHGGRYLAFAEYLAGYGFDSYLPDLRGFGESGGKRAHLSHFSDLHRDLGAMLALAFKNSPGTPVFLMGHSFGGLITSSYLAFHGSRDIRGLVLSSPAFGVALPVSRWKHCLGLLMSYLLPTYSEATPVVPRQLTHDKEILREYAKDKLIYHRISARLYRELRGMMGNRKAIAQKLKLPVLLLQAEEDFVVSKDQSLRFYDELTSSDKELELYKGFYHEILNETQRDLVYSRIGVWLLKQLSSK